jgi:hypothetical protein
MDGTFLISLIKTQEKSTLSLFFRGLFVLKEFLALNFKEYVDYNRKNFFIVNTSSDPKVSGHWIAVMIDGGKVFYFDSFDLDMRSYSRRLPAKLKEISNEDEIVTMPFAVQADSTETCGLYVLFVCLSFCNNDGGASSSFMAKGMVEKNWGFSSESKLRNDKRVVDYFHRRYGKRRICPKANVCVSLQGLMKRTVGDESVE